MSYYKDSDYSDKPENRDPNTDQVVHSRRARRMEREAAEQKAEHTPHRAQREHASRAQNAQTEASPDNGSQKHHSKKKHKLNKKQFLKFVVCVILAVALLGMTYVGVIIIKAPKIETGNIYSLLSQSSVLYDDKGEIIDNVFADQNRTIVEINQIPKDVQHAFIALEDKTFETHHGFNIIRIFGAIKDAVLGGGSISGTSTITQQLARNLYLTDKMQERSLSRKITEAYYAVILEKNLSKSEILEAYLNTVNFGSGYGVQTAAQAYFSKDIQDVTLFEAAALAAMPQLPTTYALVKQVSADSVTEDTDKLIKKNGDYAYVWNDAAASRIKICLKLMLEQGYISQEAYEEAVKTEIKDVVNPNIDALNDVSNYFADYVITQVIKDLQEQLGYDYQKAQSMVYNGGLQIYTTMDSQAQSVIEKEYKNDDNFPQPIGYSKDSKGNIRSKTGGTLLYAYSNYIESDGTFKLKSSEYQWNDDGSLTIFAGKRLAIYNTTVAGQTDYSVEMKSMYSIDNGKFYSIPGGYINIPQPYKSRDKDNNLIVSAQFFTDYPDFFEKDGKKLSTKEYSLRQKVIQPQSAMTIVDNKTGAIKAMIGGRKTVGRMLFNRATASRQPGSSIKPVAVYAPALQRSFELEAAGETFPLVDNGFDRQGTHLWGDYITTASIVDDEPTKINGKFWPVNSYRSYRGLYTFRTALQQSVNVCAVKILSQVGVDYAFDIAQKFGLTTLVKEGDSNDLNLAALGMGGLTKGVSTLEMASAYSVFVNDGKLKSSTCYTKVTNKAGDIILEPATTESDVLDAGVAWIMRNVLQTVVSEGIGSYARVSGANVGGKTGTTSDSYDIWFDGFTANYSASIWIGTDVNIKLSSMSPKAATLWGKIIGQIDGAKGGTYSKRPSNVVSATIDTKSGMLAVEGGSATRTEYFTSGTQPKEGGTLKQTVAICDESGELATPSCGSTHSETGIMRPYIPNKKVRDYSNELPHYYCHLHNPNPEVYPANPKKDVTIVEEPELPPDPGIVDDPDDPNYDPNQPLPEPGEDDDPAVDEEE